jgi:hypothetical protein
MSYVRFAEDSIIGTIGVASVVDVFYAGEVTCELPSDGSGEVATRSQIWA